MMADHWKSIANLLGAPGVDEPDEEAREEAREEAHVETHAKAPAEQTARSQPAGIRHSAPKSTSSASSKPAKSGEARQDTFREKDVSRSQKTVSSGQEAVIEPTTAGAVEDASADAVQSDPVHRLSAPESSGGAPASGLHFDPHEPIPDEALSFKSLRPKPAPSKSPSRPEPPTPTPTPPAARSFSEPSPPHTAEARREAPRMPDRTEPSTPAAAPPPETPTRRKSSWESLANMFNIKVDRSKPTEATQEVERPTPEPAQPRGSRPADDDGTRDDQPFSIFSEERGSRSNPALDAMFGDAPAPSSSSHDDWGKPRVIDDLGWDSDDSKRSGPRDDSSSSRAAQDDPPRSRTSSETASDGDDEEAPRRGRRRRRGRRGRSDSTAPSTDASPAAEKSSRSWGGLDDDTDSGTADDSEHGLHDDPWGEPDSFELIQSDDQEDQDLDSADGSDELSADGEVLRRSSRRRRRGSSDRDASEAADQLDGPRAGRGPRRAEGDESDDRGSRPPRRRRSGSDSSDMDSRARRGAATDSSSRPTSPRRPTRPSDEQGPIEDSFDDASLGPDGDEGEELSGDGQHRSIPTWADSIASLIQTNTENRKRSDNRGAPRGRPRGRR